MAFGFTSQKLIVGRHSSFFSFFLYFIITEVEKPSLYVFFNCNVRRNFLFTSIVKDYVARLRPNNVEAFAELIRILQKPSNYSFFSGHASSSFSVTTFMVLALRKFTKWIYLAYLWPLIFVMSRIYVGVHYPSDIFVGALVGTVFAFILYYFCRKTLEKTSLPNPRNS